MASRAPARSTSTSNPSAASNQSAPSTSAAPAGSNLQAPRRSQPPYLHGSMTRRPPAASSSLSVSSPTHGFGAHAGSQSTNLPADDDIIIRDEHGDFRLDMPTMTPLPRDEARDERGSSRRIEGTTSRFNQTVSGQQLPPRSWIERGWIAYDSPQRRWVPGPGKRDTQKQEHADEKPMPELKATLQASLQAKAASLDEDAWMYEGDDVTPVNPEQ
ncbi:hypothetical protein NA57DRAFT_79734 [Rhizodiscina lignyota]|uniref:Uncharacterized protein n=1 Tax=Rhizodiscina lignyota TaxID=1504668 RepID=A0A9P4I9A0_9PEZI|nr:hypothetical protein NA57DRAFT_79734 [Rhizodiscina lignyota]